MCGFSGYISLADPLSLDLLEQSLRSIKHRGPDETLIYDVENKYFISSTLSSESFQKQYKLLNRDQNARIALGFNRLSIVDLSNAAMQPFIDPKSNSIFVFNGEIYNYKELRYKYLEKEQFSSESDSEVVFKLYLKFGNSFVEKLRGMFSIVILDLNAQKLKVWRDRMGMKPFYYSFINDIFIFNSEAKGIFSYEIVQKQINPQGLAYSMYLGTCPSPLTIYKEIFTLPAASYLEFDFKTKQITVNPYWVLEYKPNDDKQNLDKWLQDVVKLHITGDVKKGIMQSGGLDSGLLAYYLGKVEPENIAYNLYAENHKIDESRFAAINAKHAGLQFEKIKVNNNIDFSELNEYLYCEEEPNQEPEPTYYLCKAVNKKGVKVLYNALGLDEIFGGYMYYRKVIKINKILPFFKFIPSFFIPLKYIEKIQTLEKYGSFISPFLARQLFSWKEINDFFPKNEMNGMDHPIEYLLNQARILYPKFDEMPLLKKVSWLDFFYYISMHHSFRSDQPAMKNSIELRFPFLDHVFIQTFFNEKNTFDGIEKGLKPKIRALASKVLDPRILKMPKKGFSMNTDQWIKDKEFTSKVGKDWYLKSLKVLFEDK